MGLDWKLEVLDGHDATSFDPVEFEVQYSVRRETADGRQCQGGHITGLSAAGRRGMVRGEVMAEELHEPKKPCWRTQICKRDERRARPCDTSIDEDT